MAVITRAYSETDGNIAYASSINKVIDDLYTLQNGNIGTTNLANSGVLNSSIGATANISYNKLDVTTLPSASLWVTQRLILEGF